MIDEMGVIALRFSLGFAVLGFAVALAQTLSVQQAFEAGLYGEAVRALAERRDAQAHTAAEVYISAQALAKLNDPERAKTELATLADQSDPAWPLVAESARALLDADTVRARELAEQAARDHPNHFFAAYQLGLVRAEQTDWNGAAAAFARASEIDPAFAYARYYAGLAYSRVNRLDLTASHFEAFLNLAPKAPERAAVESIMRTLRGR